MKLKEKIIEILSSIVNVDFDDVKVWHWLLLFLVLGLIRFILHV